MRRVYDRYLDLSYRRPWPALLIAFALSGIAVAVTSRLELRTDLRELLPRHYRSITDLERIEKRAGGVGTLTIGVESDDPGANVRFIEALAGGLRRFPADEVRWVDYHVHHERAFFERNKLLYADLGDLVTFRKRLKAKIEEERRKRDPFHLDLEPAAPAPALDVDAYKRKYESKVRKFDRYPGGYYVGESGRLAALFVRVPGSATAVENTRRLLSKVQALVTGLSPPLSMKVGYTGDVITALEEYEATKVDLFLVSGVCIGLVLLVILLFFLNVRSLFVLGVPLLMGVAWTFGLTTIAIGYLNVSTMFLASIVAGNGINFGIILLARYFEERRSGAGMREALSIATAHTARATAVASLAAGVAYASLLLIDFRGFNQFGFIGGVGMVLCWLATFLVMPPFLAVSERLYPFFRRPQKRARWSLFSAGFAALVTRYPKAIALFGLVTFAAGAIIGLRFLYRDPFLYNFRHMRIERGFETGSGALAQRVSKILEPASARPVGMVLLADRLDQVPRLTAVLERMRDSVPREQQPIGDVTTLYSLLPADQERKLPVLAEIRELITKNALKFLTPAQRTEVQNLTPPADLRPIGIGDLPEKMARAFTDVDGVRGLLFYVALGWEMSAWDGRDLLRFSAAVRSIRLPGGEVIHGSGSPVIFADMLQAVLTDGPRAALLSFAGVVALVILAFRRLVPIAFTLGALLCGLAWLVGAMGAWDLYAREWAANPENTEAFVSGVPKLNFLNFVVLPLTIGIGVDYAVNIYQRYLAEGEGSMRRVLESTGGAVVLCSLTTIIGYSSLLLSDNLALVSFGKLANLGEVTCLLAAVVVLPSLVVLVERLRARRRARAQAAELSENRAP